MERLTFKSGDDYWAVNNDNCYEDQSEDYCGPAIDKLGAYEDTGLTPEQVAALKQELVDERYRHDRLQDFEVDGAQELAALKEKCRWIPVTERLPEMHTKVLCCGRKGGRFIAELSSWGSEQNLYWTKHNGKGCSEVVWWRPLPESPEVN